MEVFKEFLRLKREEIRYWFKYYFFDKICMPIIVTVLILWICISGIFIGFYICGICPNNYVELFITLSALIWISAGSILLLSVISKWLKSNWAQAKKNVKEKNMPTIHPSIYE